MRRLITILIVLTCIVSNSFAQLKTHITIEGGPAWDISRVIGSESYFEKSYIPGTVGGVALYQEFGRNACFGTGAYFHSYSSGINPLDSRPHQPSVHSYSAILIPFRIQLRFPISTSGLSISTRFGYQFGYLLDNPQLQSTSSYFSNATGTALHYTLQEDLPLNNSLHLIETGMSIDYRFDNNFMLSISQGHYGGLRPVKNSVITYQDSNGEENEISYSNNGKRRQITFSLYIPVSNLWEKKDIRMHRKIEGRRSQGRDVKVKRYIYFGGNFGSIWRSFFSTNPAIGPRPIENRGIFKYANIHTGAFFGYRFNDRISMDVGANYQRSTTFFSLMYDHEVDYVVKNKAPFFLEFPFMVRYSYEVSKNINIVPTMGAAFMMHFSGGEFDNGTGSFNLTTVSGNTNASVNYTAERLARFGYLMKVGSGVEYTLATKIPMIACANITYTHGFQNIDQITITTSLTETPEESYITYGGSGWNFSLGVKIPILLGKRNRACGAQERTRD